MSESGREYARRLRGAEMAKEQVCTKCGVSVSPLLSLCTECATPCERCDVFLRRIEKLEAERDKLRESSEKLLDLNFGFMEQNRKLREENARLKVALTGLLHYHDKCGMESSYGVYAREVLASLPKPPEVGK